MEGKVAGFYIPLDTEERRRLISSARIACRTPRDQARYLLLEALGLRNTETEKTIVSVQDNTNAKKESV